MARQGKVIVSCAVTGSIHVPSQTPYLPITPDQIADSAIGAANAGAASLHLHARDLRLNPQTGNHAQLPDPIEHEGQTMRPSLRRRLPSSDSRAPVLM